MVKGIEIFREYFRDYQDQYVLIGGTACDLLFEEYGGEFRATKDLDMVLIIEALTPEFGNSFWDFIKAGQYQNRQKSNGQPQYYRFDKPQNSEFPSMIELFSRTAALVENPETPCVPIHIDDGISSLSAILLDTDYYNLLQTGKAALSDIVILSTEYLIPFKAKAWLDLSEKIKTNPDIGQRNVKKHKNDILRLATMLTGNERPGLPEAVRNDMADFVAELHSEPIDLRALGITGVSIEERISLLKEVYILSES